jgi:hypothetical protein
MGNSPAYYQELLDAIPLIVFVVDDDVRIQEMNDTARELFGPNKAVFKRRAGEVFHCLHWQDSPDGCGRGEFCKNCIIRNAVTQCLKGQLVKRKRMKVSFQIGDARKSLDLLLTTSPVPNRERKLALLMIEDITELVKLRDLIPVCMHCGKIRDDRDFWHEVAEYFKESAGYDYTHGICPSCIESHFPEICMHANANDGGQGDT